MQLLRLGILMLCWLGTNAFLSRKGAAGTLNAKPLSIVKSKNNKNNNIKDKDKNNIKDKNKKNSRNNNPTKEKGGLSKSSKVEPKGRRTNSSTKGTSTALVEASWMSEQFQSLSAFVMSRPAAGEAPYILVGVRYCILAMFFCLAAVAIIDSFSQVPSLFGEATIVVSRPSG